MWQAGLIDSLYKGEYEDVVQCKECGHYSPKPGAPPKQPLCPVALVRSFGPFGSGAEQVRLDPALLAVSARLTSIVT